MKGKGEKFYLINVAVRRETYTRGTLSVAHNSQPVTIKMQQGRQSNPTNTIDWLHLNTLGPMHLCWE